MIGRLKKMGGAVLAGALLLALGAGCSDKKEPVSLDPKNPVTINIWHYYNGAQKTAFDQLIAEFNESVGREKGIIVEGVNQGSVSKLTEAIIDSAQNKVGTDPVPNIFAAYADTAYQIDALGLVADLGQYLTQEEIDAYIPSYMEEGRLTSDGKLKIFPTAKSTEIFMLNKTDWDAFASATGASLDALSTMEGLAQTAKAYYDWTDSLTPEVPDDGKAFFGRDAMANYFIIGAKQLGCEIFSVADNQVSFQLDEAVFRKLWDNYYVPFINGWFGASGRFRSDDIKMGNIIACVGSSSGAAYFPDECILSDTESYPIEMRAYPCPKFEGGEDFAVQQGAGLVVTNAAPQEVEASVEFLKWFTEAGRNLEFSLGSGYVPVKKEANEMTFVEQAMDAAGASSKMRAIITNAISMTGENQMYTTKAFRNGTAARAILNDSMVEKARADREAFLALTAEGMPHEEAAAQFVTEIKNLLEHPMSLMV